jgi:hypothetical protein
MSWLVRKLPGGGLAMRDTEFFEPVEQVLVYWRGKEYPFPVFYYDLTSVMAYFLTPVEKVVSLLPSDRLFPMRIIPGKAVTSIIFYEYRDSDIGPYNEMLIGFPVTIDRPAPMGLGMRTAELRGASAYIWHLPVTTEIARDMGIDVAGYPKILSNITFETDDGWLRCRTEANGQHVLTLSVRRPRTKRVERRWPLDAITVKDQQVLRVPAVMNLRNLGGSWRAGNAKLETGDHPIGREVAELDLGRVLAMRYSPDSQIILSRPIEGWPATKPLARPSYPEEEPQPAST